MTILICTGFYIYVIFSVNVYRKEILLRQKEGCVIKGKVKAPYPLRISVLLSLVALAANVCLFQFAGNEMTILINTFPVLFCTILINTFPVLFCTNLLWRYERKIKKIDRENL